MIQQDFFFWHALYLYILENNKHKKQKKETHTSPFSPFVPYQKTNEQVRGPLWCVIPHLISLHLTRHLTLSSPHLTSLHLKLTSFTPLPQFHRIARSPFLLHIPYYSPSYPLLSSPLSDILGAMHNPWWKTCHLVVCSLFLSFTFMLLCIL